MRHATDTHLGEFEQLVLLALLRLRDDGYGVAVQREIQRRTGRRIAFGSVYAALARLETKGLATSRLGDPTPERGGRRKKYFTILPAGRRAVERTVRAMRRMTQGIDAAWEGP
jgi:DNA-binding PadR family transcriptional regulator